MVAPARNSTTSNGVSPNDGVTDAVTIVIVHWNDPQRCETALGALEQCEPVRSVVVVDNGSTAANRETLTDVVQRSPLSIEVLWTGQNLGFGPGANRGLEHWLETGGGEWVGLMPHDALVSPTCLRTMLDVLGDHPQAGLACADVGDGSTPVIDPYLGGLVAPSSVEAGWESAAYPHGTLLLARRQCLADVGLFDERYFAYVEEAELGLRVRARGWDIGIVRGAMVRNPFMGPGQAARDYLQQRNTMLLVREHFGWRQGAFRTMATLWQLIAGLIRPAKRPDMYVARARWMALRDHLRGTYGPPPQTLYES